MRIFKKALTLSDIILSRVIYVLSFLMPRDKKLWIFVGWHQNSEREIFADNSKYLFLHTANNIPSVKAVWIGRDNRICNILNKEGYDAYSIRSLKGVYYSLRAGFTFIDAFMRLENWRLSGQSKVIQLWHGKGPKKTGYSSPYSLAAYSKFTSPNLFRKFHYFIASSDYTAGLVSSSFRIRKEKILVSGLPKYDVLFDDIGGSRIDINMNLRNKIREARSQNFDKLIFYAPTFRPDGSNPLMQLELAQLNNFLLKKNYFLIGSLHPKFSMKNWAPKDRFSNIHFTESGYDIYPLLKNFDLLITDYSSLAVDFLLIDKPTIFFVYDIEKYRKEMGLHEDFWDLIPGPRAYNFNQLLSALDSEMETSDYENKKRVAKEKLFAYRDGGAAKRITEKLLSQL